MNTPEIATMPLSSLKAAPYNPRRISAEAMAGLEASLDRFGLVQPIIWNKRTGYVVGGHQRLKALRKQKVKLAPVVIVDLDSGEEKALNVALNSPHIAGEFTAKLDAVLDDIKFSEPTLFSDLCLDALLEDMHGTADDTSKSSQRLDDDKSVICPACSHEFTP